MIFRRACLITGLVLSVCFLSACESYRRHGIKEPIVGYENPGVLSRFESRFVVGVVRDLEAEYYKPEALDYCELYNAALKGVQEELELHSVRWGFRPITDCHTNYSAGERFQIEFDRAWRIQGEARNLGDHDLVFAATSSMLDSLGRSHTYFIYPENVGNDDGEYDGPPMSRLSKYATGKRIHDGDYDWSYVRFREFCNSAHSQFVDLYHDPGIFEMSVNGVILDLRGNPGGSHRVLKTMLSIFLRNGTEAFYTKGHKFTETFTTRNEPLTLLPLVVLIDENSGSAAEIFAAVIQESKRGVVVGKKSMGAVEVAHRIDLPYRSQMTVTIAQIYTASGKQMEGVGVEPDFEAERTEADILKGRDPCLEKATEILKELCDPK